MHDISKDRQLTEILTILFNGNLDNEKSKQIYDQLREICEDKDRYSRPHYSVISKFINDMYTKYGKSMILDDGYTKIDLIIEELAMIEEFNKDTGKDSFEIFIDKITDHLTMENDRALLFLKHREYIEDTKRDFSKLNDKIKELDKNATEAQGAYFKIAKSLTDNKIENITILSIFTGIVMSGMGMLSLTSSLFSELTNNNLYGLLALGCFCGLMLILFVYVMVRYIGKIVLNFYDTNKTKIDSFIVVLSIAFTALFLFCLWKYQA